MIREAPMRAKCRAASNPTPALPPVMRIVWSLNASGAGVERYINGSLKSLRRPMSDAMIAEDFNDDDIILEQMTQFILNY
jgi:hypothetical protein